MVEWIIHLKDGTTLTDDDCNGPHEVDSELITSVERVIGGKTLTIKKSPLIEDFFIATEVGQDVKMMGRDAGKSFPPQITKRIIGCYIKNTEPPIQCRLIMDPRTFNAIFEAYAVETKTKKGINARRLKKPPKGVIIPAYQKEFASNVYSILQSPEIHRTFSTPIGLGCLIKKPRIRAELIIRSQNVLLGFTQPNERLTPA